MSQYEGADESSDNDILSTEEDDEITELEEECNNQTKIIVPEHLHLTSDRLTLAELTEAITIRINQIDKGSPVFVEHSHLNSTTEIALYELAQKKSPLLLTRIVSETRNEIKYEIKNINDMILPIKDFSDLCPSKKQFEKCVI
jgi:DNA-directed RNA polymerase subunit K/omega